MDQAVATGLGSKSRKHLVLLVLAASIGLLLVHLGIDFAWPGFQDHTALTLLYTLLLAVPALIGLLLHNDGELLPWVAGGLYGLLLVPLAWFTSHAVDPDVAYGGPSIYFPFAAVVAIVTFVAVPFVQALRSGPSFLHYPALFEFAWANALALLIVPVFTGACWLILVLWQELFAVIGIRFFSELFKQPEFFYPATGVFIGIGAVLGRTQAVAVRTLLNICLMLGRILFPLIGAVVLLFLGALVFTGLDPLWKTRHAAVLLLTLVAFAIALFSAVYQDGQRPATYGKGLRKVSNVTLLALPVFAVIAGYALWLRTREFALTQERLWGWLVLVVLALHAFAYAAAVVVPRKPWLAMVGPANSWIALASIGVLLLTQTPLLDLRTIAVRSQVERAFAPGGDPAKIDLAYLRSSGRPGTEALDALATDPRIVGNKELVAAIHEIRTSKTPFLDRGKPEAPIDESTFAVVPVGTPLPAGLLDAIREHQAKPPSGGEGRDCTAAPGSCLLLSAAIGPDGGTAWIEFDKDCWRCLPVYTQESGTWKFSGTLEGVGPNQANLIREIKNLHYATEAPAWKDLVVNGEKRYHFTPAR